MTGPTGDRTATAFSSSERLVVLGGLGLAVASLVPWYKAEEFAFEATRTNGWQEPDAVLSQLATILGVIVAVSVLIAGSQRHRPQVGGLSWGTALTAASTVVAGLVALKFSLNMDGTTVGIYLALLAAVTELYGAYVTRLTEERPGPTPVPFPLAGSPAAPARPPPPSTAAAPPAPAPAPGPVAAAPAATWPETAYLLGQWLRPDTDPTAALTAYRTAFAADPARLARLVAELHGLLDPRRSEAERTALLTAHAPHLAGNGATPVLGWLAQALTPPPAP